MAYNMSVESFRDEEYPMLQGKAYLDHGGTTLYAKSLIREFSLKMSSNLYGNPHSNSDPAQLSSRVVQSTRHATLAFFGADPEHFDLIFTANATAAIKLVGESFQDLAASGSTAGTFFYGYHRDAHTSIVGVRELTQGTHHCFVSDQEVESWLDGAPSMSNIPNVAGLPGLLAYPGQSNMTGRRLPLSWPRKLRRSTIRYHQNTYSLLDAAALATTKQLDFSDPESAPDFTAVSFYKIFGFPDLGALIVRKKSGHILSWRRYFGGGTVDMLTVLHGPTVQRKSSSLHDALEDGTLPFHNIMALGCAIDVHKSLYGSMKKISLHTTYLARRLYLGMTSLCHFNGLPVCVIHNDVNGDHAYEDPATQGATIAFSIVRHDGTFVGHSAVEKLANDDGIYVRAGGLCNAGGISTYLKVEPWQFNRAWSAGHRCGEGMFEIINGLPTGVVRASLGAMSTLADVDTLLEFLSATFESKGDTVTVFGHGGFELENVSSKTDSGFHSRAGSQEYPAVISKLPTQDANHPQSNESRLELRKLQTQQSFYCRTGRHDMGRYYEPEQRSQIPLYVLGTRPHTAHSKNTTPAGAFQYRAEATAGQGLSKAVGGGGFDGTRGKRSKFKFWKGGRSEEFPSTAQGV